MKCQRIKIQLDCGESAKNMIRFWDENEGESIAFSNSLSLSPVSSYIKALEGKRS
jgi:hypothetical protein